ncbi:MAG: FAD/NAD(P)-binding protein [Anaerolineales bacterium]|nr:FAD/NAD(P)-binding protein [Anaerolineales bacterium]MCX7609449.1 FAD/NAD(P)-binding protein [Anaerolineales bacterium]MDW8227691.1 FAD/NAD(P)-binding protein [Anaerolineales bacterium]
MTALPETAIHPNLLLYPYWAEVIRIKKEAEGVGTIWLRFIDPEVRAGYRFAPGQFNMLYLPGYGEAAISISSDPEETGVIAHTIRFVGNVTKAISRLKERDVIGVRGPFGTPWPMQEIEGRDVVIASGGIGLAPLRPAIYHILHHRDKYGKVLLIYGARTPADLLYPEEYEQWRAGGIDVQITVDRADETWDGQVGVVPMLFYRFRIDHRQSAVLTCGPEIMIRFVIYEGLARRIPPERIYVSLERNMKCGQGACGHCQLGPYFICKDGPVFRFDMLQEYFNVEEY